MAQQRNGRPSNTRRYAIQQALLAETNGHCYLCGTTVSADLPAHDPNRAECGHIVPDTMGGTHTTANMVILCRACNDAAGDADLSAYVPATRVAPVPMTDGQAARAMDARRDAMDAAKRERRARWQTV